MFLIDGSAGNTIVNLGSAVTLLGGGVVTLKSGSGSAFLRGSGFTLTNTANTIQGAGNIGDSGALSIVNKATIDADSLGSWAQRQRRQRRRHRSRNARSVHRPETLQPLQ